MKFLLSLFILLTLNALAYSQGNNGLVGHWPLNGSTNDASANGLNGNITGTVTNAAGYNGIANTAMNFIAGGKGIEVPYNNLLKLDSFSMCALVRVRRFSPASCQSTTIMSRISPAKAEYYLEFCDNFFDNSCAIYTPTQNRTDVAGHYTGLTNASLLPGPIIDTGKWYCVVGTFAQNTVKIYINGSLVISAPVTNTFPTIGGSLTIGYLVAPTVSGQFEGLIDDVRLYSRALSIAEVDMYCDSAKMWPHCDTLILRDTAHLNIITARDTVTIHDTTHRNIIVRDTTTIHDTTHHNIAIHDTTIIATHDTVHHTNTIRDTIIVRDTVHHTNTIHDSTIIVVRNIILEPGKDSSMWIPSAFSPNGDGKNDVFRIVNLKNMTLQCMRIFNRWGEQIFYSNDANIGWDGTFKGTPQDMGVYFYDIIVLPNNSNNPQRYKGEVTLIK